MLTARPTATAETTTTRWLMLGVLSLAVLLCMSPWFSASATSAQLRAQWSLSASAAGWLTTTVQLGFVAGTALAAVLNLADIVPSRRYFATSALLAALANAALAVVPSYAAALGSRFLVGFFLAGVYPPAMKMAATWFLDARGLAIGILVGALTVGKAGPYLVSAAGAPDHVTVSLTSSGGALLGAVLIGALYHDGPFPFARRPFSWRLVGTVLRDRPTRLAIGGYLGHMWELYACWTALSIFFYDFFSQHGASDVRAPLLAGLVTFAAIAAGGVGSVLAGVRADRLGRERVASAAMAVSGACALLIGWLLPAPAWVVVSIALIWGFAVVADSAQFSALVTEVSPAHAVGTALTLQTSLGFLLTAFSIWLTFQVSAAWGWGAAFSLLAIGPVYGIWQMVLLARSRNV